VSKPSKAPTSSLRPTSERCRRNSAYVDLAGESLLAELGPAACRRHSHTDTLLQLIAHTRSLTSRYRVDNEVSFGMWMGGRVPLGYDLKDRKLVINPVEG
ncbi:hypothetical protein, partial [Mesorhizobium sp. B2-4-15]|uniref:hypothetical protein n=1 Tax=Mesorhizobium sp. B2-4-15 TaxID=2589934 RepID=UPI001AEE68FE